LWRPLHEAGGDPLYNNTCFWWGASGNNNSNFWEGEYYNPDSHKKEVYSHKKNHHTRPTSRFTKLSNGIKNRK